MFLYGNIVFFQFSKVVCQITLRHGTLAVEKATRLGEQLQYKTRVEVLVNLRWLSSRLTAYNCGCVRKSIQHTTLLHNTYDGSPLGFITSRQTTTPYLGEDVV